MLKKLTALAFGAVLLAGCDTLGESAGLGAGMGAGVALATGGNPVTGAAIGAGAGVLCHQTNSC